MSRAEVMTTSASRPAIPRHQQEWTRARSSTEPAIKPSETFHSARFSFDASPQTSGTERDDTWSTLGSASRTGNRPFNKTAPTIPPRKPHNRKTSGTAKSPTVPTFHTKPGTRDPRPSEPAPIAFEALNPPTTEIRSSAQRRPPASHSSYGIETSCGPPPSFSTQRTLSQDRLWKPTPPDKADGQPKPNVGPAQHEAEKQSTPEMDTVSSIDPADTLVDDADQTLRIPNARNTDEDSKGSSSEDRKSEDLFLNIAKADSAQQDLASRAGRRSRGSLAHLSNASHGVAPREVPTPPDGPHFDAGFLSPRIEAPTHFSKRSSLGYHSSAASAHPLDQSHRRRFFSGASKMTSTAGRNVHDREITPELPQNYRGSSTDLETRTDPRANYLTIERPRYADRNTTESSVSTTAPSTVWDELDDLKSRIRKLELTGKLPSSSAAAMSSAERPRTATTTVTTMSSSPQYGKAGSSPQESAIDGIPSNVHPLLHEGLSKAKSVVSTEIYQKLEATASDALQLASMMGAGSQPSPAAAMGMPSSAERQIRRRADSMCRGLTELAIALSAESRSLPQPIRPPSRDVSSLHNNSMPSTFLSQRLSNEPEDRQALPSRVQSRLETRRSSHMVNNRTGYSTPGSSAYTTPLTQPQLQPMSSSRLNRTSTFLRNRDTHGPLDGAGDEAEGSPAVRPVSRAMTEVGGSAGRRYSPRDRTTLSREYTSQHPMPTTYEGNDGAHRSPLPTGLTSVHSLRRADGSSSSVVGSHSNFAPLTPREGLMRRLDMGRRSSGMLSSTESTPENVTLERGSGPRRSFGLASRIGSTVGSRLRAVRAEKYSNAKEQEKQQHMAQQEMAQLQQESENLSMQDQVEQESASVYEE